MVVSKKTKIWVLVLLLIVVGVGWFFYSGKMSLFQGFMKIDKRVVVKVNEVLEGKVSSQVLTIKTASVPTAQTIAAGSTVVIAAFDIVVPSSVASAEIKSIKVTKGGLMSPSDVSELKLIYCGDDTDSPQIYTPVIADVNGASFVFHSSIDGQTLFTIPGGTTGKIAFETTIKPDASTGTIYYYLKEANDVKANMKVKSTTFPVNGPTMAVVAAPAVVN